MSKRLTGLPPEWQNFFMCVSLHLALPLLPLGLEKWITGHVDAKSAALTAAMYSLALGFSSKNLFIFALGVLQGVIFSAAFGALSKTPTLEYANNASYLAILLILTVHALERYNRHVFDKLPFLEFMSLHLPPTQATSPQNI